MEEDNIVPANEDEKEEKPSSNKLQMLIVSLLVIILMALIGGGSYYLGQRNKAEDVQATPTPVPTQPIQEMLEEEINEADVNPVVEGAQTTITPTATLTPSPVPTATNTPSPIPTQKFLYKPDIKYTLPLVSPTP